jgi:hypothetical protein
MAVRIVAYCLSSSLGFCAPRNVRRSCAAANKGLIAFFLRTTSATIASSPVDVDLARQHFFKWIHNRLSDPNHVLFSKQIDEIEM